MKLSKTSAQAALAMAFLAQQEPKTLIQAKHVAEHLDIPADSALKILQALARHRLILSQLGRNGGYRLQKAPKDVTLLQIVEAIDGPLSGQMRLDSAPKGTAASVDVLQSIVDQAAEQLRQQLSGATVADLARKSPSSSAPRLVATA